MARVWNETFQTNPGYDETWDQGETIGTGNVVDEDFLVSSVTNPGSAWGTLCLKSSNDGSGGGGAYPGHDGFSLADSWLRFEVNVVNLPVSSQRILSVWDTGAGKLMYAFRISTGGLSVESWHDGTESVYTSFITAAINTTYRIEVKWDSTNDVWAWRVDGVDQPNNVDASDPVTSEGTLTSTHVTSMGLMRCGVQLNNRNIGVYYALVAIDNADWVGAEVGGGTTGGPSGGSLRYTGAVQ